MSELEKAPDRKSKRVLQLEAQVVRIHINQTHLLLTGNFRNY